jgi:hypothetical protein
MLPRFVQATVVGFRAKLKGEIEGLLG